MLALKAGGSRRIEKRAANTDAACTDIGRIYSFVRLGMFGGVPR